MISYYQAPYAQKGYGFGGIFRGLTKFIAPLASGISKVVGNPTVQSIAKDAIRTGVGIAADAIEGRESDAKEQSARLLKRARTKVAREIRIINPDSETDSDDAYDVSNTPKYRKKEKLKGRLVKKKRRTIFDE